MQARLETVLRKDRQIIAASLLLVSVVCWVYLFWGAGMDMSGIDMTRHSMMEMNAPLHPWTASYALLMFFMWWVMMIAMMLPSATPVILLASALNRLSEPGKEPFGSAYAFASGYLLAWAGFSLLMVGLQWLLSEAGMVSGLLKSSSRELSAILLMAAGLWQFSPWKQTCLRHCRGPVEYLTRHRNPGNSGAMLMGMGHGLYCLGCCWFLMVLLFVGGVMNLLWIAALAVYVWVEKVAPGGQWLSRAMGVLLIGWAAVIFLIN
ncbi:MAG: DUF2182 domain-containing protein [Xanthomonadales bacterium]|nr:DUF2182 domain-containing protein [Gammaproteobacteria bacterium]NNE05396.1 DUF2182 domain-containing protein [Xanthomonadales bacterium]NNL95291.1 DUF2182 domain-containing protein [Xanthomonadales bacterium]